MSDAAAGDPPSIALNGPEGNQDPPARPKTVYTSELDAKLHELDQALRSDVISAFKEFEKVLRRTRQELARERFARRDFEETAAIRINQLQAMVDEFAPRVGPQRRGANHERRSERNERQRQQWEAMMWHN